MSLGRFMLDFLTGEVVDADGSPIRSMLEENSGGPRCTRCGGSPPAGTGCLLCGAGTEALSALQRKMVRGESAMAAASRESAAKLEFSGWLRPIAASLREAMVAAGMPNHLPPHAPRRWRREAVRDGSWRELRDLRRARRRDLRRKGAA